jgi:hypothetical protein
MIIYNKTVIYIVIWKSYIFDLLDHGTIFSNFDSHKDHGTPAHQATQEEGNPQEWHTT